MAVEERGHKDQRQAALAELALAAVEAEAVVSPLAMRLPAQAVLARPRIALLTRFLGVPRRLVLVAARVVAVEAQRQTLV